MAKASKTEKVLANLGLRITELRRKAGMTQEDLANVMQVTVKYVQRIEAGSENLTIGSILRVAEVVDADFRTLFDHPTISRPKRGRPPGSS